MSPKKLEDVAILHDGQTTYLAQSPKGCLALDSAPLALIRGIYDMKPDQARRIVRHRIWTTAKLSSSLQGMVKVAAKRVTSDLDPEAPELRITAEKTLIQIHSERLWMPEPISLPDAQIPAPGARSEKWLALADALAHPISSSKASEKPRYACDRPVAALLVSRTGTLLGAAVNTNGKNRALHAEINLLLEYGRRSGKKLPAGSTVFTTLKPCKMCAGAIYDSADDRGDLRVVYAEDDPGKQARHTALDLCPEAIQSQWDPI